jgi:protein arginine kinase
MSDATLGDFARRSGEWLRGAGPMNEIVVSTRVRLARNLKGYLFLSRADAEMRAEIAEVAAGAIRRADPLVDLIHLDIAGLDELDRQLLVERHLISKQHAESSGARRVAFSPDESAAIMVNEEDHLRIQVMASGLQIESSWERINRFDDALEEQLEFAFHPQFGYLTACPTNVGTGMRVSVMLHLPALRLTNDLSKVASIAQEMKLAVRGLHGEGTEALGDFFQVSNQITLEKSERDIIDDLHSSAIPRIVELEATARRELLKHRVLALDDKIWRAFGALRNARLISSNEAMQYLSHLRMGVHTGRIDRVPQDTVNQLFLQIQQAHLQKLHGRRLTGEERSIARANYIRERLSEN